uniref:coiled-coil-helix-coiled-coil-helix domain containing 4b isoform X2 n=1 Tax=Scatophagus argus TaxID=75038 RepID=UPI001ED7E63A|nr:coiled-coil-helix-coiled-coil-helix domain containing 4b isoform X2 [Scatophagus argus]
MLITVMINHGKIPEGLILPSGEINWSCPCLGGMASGPCGTEFKDAFSCFHYSKEEVKGSECLEQFRAMQECMQRYPELYPQEDEKTPQEQSSETDQTSQDSAFAEASGANSASATEQDTNSTQPNTKSSEES